MIIQAVFWLLTVALSAPAAERPVPPPGITIAEADRQILESGLRLLGERIAQLKKQEGLRSPLVADVAIFHEAVRYALHYNEFLKPEEVARAKEMLREGQQRADYLSGGRAPWAVQSGLVVRGYYSKIDDSVQPYGLVVPPSWSPGAGHPWRLDAWFHGRNENLTELNFLHDRMTNPGQFTPRDTIVLHLYGRYCNANKFAGEVDLFEALETVKQQYKIDPNRISVRGFSMGGAAAWHIGAHHAGEWAAVAPGAGFAETAEFLKVFQNESVQPAWWEQKLWRLYDATAYAINFANVPVVAYSGEKDRQIQAAQVMEREMAKQGMTLRHIIGPDTAHRYHPDSKLEIDRAIDAIVARGRDEYPRRVRLITYTLRYNRMKWVRVDGLEQHWEPARIDAVVVSDRELTVKTSGVTAFTLEFGPGGALLDPAEKVTVIVDGTAVTVRGPASDRSWSASFVKRAGSWVAESPTPSLELRKRHGLQGPVDDAFLDRFIIVKPTGQSRNPKVAAWVEAEMKRAITEWRRQFRGEALVKTDAEITDQDIEQANLVLWGEPDTNRLLARIAGRLPIGWAGSEILVGDKRYPAADHALILIYPNPLNPRRYVVLNSGFTYREYDYLNNARQVPKLPDWAVVDLSIPPDSRWPGRIASAGFFGERWELPARSPETAPPASPRPPAKKAVPKKRATKG
jgi:dienelactone hydrolase